MGRKYSQTFDEFVKDVIRRKDAITSAEPDTSQSALDNLAGNVFEPVRQMRLKQHLDDAVKRAIDVTSLLNTMEDADQRNTTAKAWEGLMKVVLLHSSGFGRWSQRQELVYA